MKAALGIVLVFLAFRSFQFVMAKYPYISATEIAEIKTFNPPPGFILAISADDAPWLDAYAQNQRLGAPGLLEDPHTYQEWLSFWQGQNQRQFIAHYPRPLYFYQRSWHLPNLDVGKCLMPLTQNFSQVNFECVEKIQE